MGMFLTSLLERQAALASMCGVSVALKSRSPGQYTARVGLLAIVIDRLSLYETLLTTFIFASSQGDILAPRLHKLRAKYFTKVNSITPSEPPYQHYTRFEMQPGRSIAFGASAGPNRWDFRKFSSGN
jgi:hypothetical protein